MFGVSLELIDEVNRNRGQNKDGELKIATSKLARRACVSCGRTKLALSSYAADRNFDSDRPPAAVE